MDERKIAFMSMDRSIGNVTFEDVTDAEIDAMELAVRMGVTIVIHGYSVVPTRVEVLRNPLDITTYGGELKYIDAKRREMQVAFRLVL